MTSNILDQFVNRTRRLYTLPAVALQVVELTGQPAIDAQALKDCIENDPALTTKILRVVNSSLFGLGQRVTDLHQALALLGTKPLKLLVLGFSLPPQLLAGLEADILQRYWRRTLIKAVAARELAERLWRMPGDDAFIAGLLQDLGMLVLIQDLGDAYLKFLDRIYHDGSSLPDFETATLGFDHVTLSARLLDHWGLPKSLVRHVSRTFDAAMLADLPARERAVPQILHLADLVAEFLTQEKARVLHELMAVGGRYRDVSFDEIESLVTALEQKVPQLAEILSLSLAGGTPYTTILAQAYAQLGDAAESASSELLHTQQLGVAEAASDWGELLRQTRLLGHETREFAEARSNTCIVPPNSRRQEIVTVPAGHVRQDTFAPVRDLESQGDAALLNRIDAAVKACRQARHPLSLAVLELDHIDAVQSHLGTVPFERMLARLQSNLRALLGDEGRWMQVGDHRFAVLMEGADRQPAVELIRRLVRCTREWSAEQAATLGHAVSLSAGVATLAMPPQNFPGQELFAAAQRCLHGVQLSGGDSVKSIDI